MITSNIKISLDSDTATQIALDTNFTYDVGFNLPMPRLSKLELLGINGDVDITNALGAATYGNRVVNMSLAVKNSTANGDTVCDSFINTYDGENVRLYIGSSYFLRGRLTVIGDNRADALRQLSVTINAEPLRYSTTYTPSASGLDITPENLGANLWSAENVTPLDTGMTVTASGGTIAANAPITSGEGHMFDVDTAVIGSGKLLRFYFSSLVNCKIELRNRGKVIGEGKGTILVFTDDGQCSINVFRKDETAEASFACTIREITTHTVNNAGKAVPFAVNHYYSASIDRIPKMYVNGTVFSLGGLASESIWDEYAPAVLRSGNNVVAAFIDYGNFDASGANGTIKIRYRKGVL